MKRLNRKNHDSRCRSSAARIGQDSCQDVLFQINQVKEAALAEFGPAFPAREKLLRLALNEAEALAWETPFPHLVFPGLAAEKAQEMMAWSKRQRSVRHNSSVMAFSA